jgi:hypothetical protein
MQVAVEFNECAARCEMGVLGRLVHSHDSHGAGVSPLEQRTPLVAGLGPENGLELLPQIRPIRASF